MEVLVNGGVRLISWAATGFVAGVSLISFGLGLLTLPAALLAAGLLTVGTMRLEPRGILALCVGIAALLAAEVTILVGLGGSTRGQQALTILAALAFGLGLFVHGISAATSKLVAWAVVDLALVIVWLTDSPAANALIVVASLFAAALLVGGLRRLDAVGVLGGCGLLLAAVGSVDLGAPILIGAIVGATAWIMTELRPRGRPA
jgi:hypothetical protein